MQIIALTVLSYHSIFSPFLSFLFYIIFNQLLRS
jgi:hypothetical protein